MTHHDPSELCGQAITDRDCCVTFWRHEQRMVTAYGKSYGKLCRSQLKLHSGGTATGAIADGTDVYEFTGDVRKIILKGVVQVESATSYPRVIDNPYPDSTVGEIASEFALGPGSSRAAFTTNAIGDGDNLYIARGVASDGELPSEIQLVSEGIVAGVADLDWQDEDTVTFWRDGFKCKQTMVEPNVISKPIAIENEPAPASDAIGGSD